MYICVGVSWPYVQLYMIIIMNDSYDSHNFAVPAVYDITICYREGEPTIMDVVNAESCKADIYVRRLSTSDIPIQSDQAMSDWLIKVYQEKVCYRSIVSM